MTDVVRYLAGCGVSLNEETPTGYLPVHLAAMNGHARTVQELVSFGAEVDAKSVDQQTPLHLAAMGLVLETFFCTPNLLSKETSHQT